MSSTIGRMKGYDRKVYYMIFLYIYTSDILLFAASEGMPGNSSLGVTPDSSFYYFLISTHIE